MNKIISLDKLKIGEEITPRKSAIVYWLVKKERDIGIFATPVMLKDTGNGEETKEIELYKIKNPIIYKRSFGFEVELNKEPQRLKIGTSEYKEYLKLLKNLKLIK